MPPLVSCDALLPWLSAGGTFVLANIRGSGELGTAWHTAAIRENRQRSFDDFYAVAEDLIARGITSRERLTATGMSNSGLLTSVALTQRPELFRAVVSGVPLTDMLRFHRLLAGPSWMAEYGNPDVPADREFLERYSPLQQIKAAKDDPEALYYSSTADDRVHPGHARRIVAKLRAIGHPVLDDEATQGGHAGSSTSGEAGLMAAIQVTLLTQKTGLSG